MAAPSSSARPRVLFVCRGSVDDGLGHVIRTSVVAEAALSSLDPEIVVIGDGTAERLLETSPVPWRIVASEREAIVRTEECSAEAVALDMTELSEADFAQLARGRLTVALSPIFTQLPAVDLAFSRTRYGRDGALIEAEGHHHGLEYSVVRPGCRPIDTGTFARNLDEPDLSIAISMGGADAPNRTLAVLEALRSLDEPATFWVLLGEGYAHSYRELVECVRRDTRHEIILAKTNRSMWRTLGNCSLGILAGGVTTYEAAHAGLPSVNVLSSADDRFLIQELVERGVAFDGGVLSEGLEPLVAAVSGLARDREGLLMAHRASRGLVDGEGARRIVELVSAALRNADRERLPVS